MSPSGDELIFGSADGYLHLWALNAEPRVSQLSRPLEQVPRVAAPPAASLTESDSFALAAVYPADQVPDHNPEACHLCVRQQSIGSVSTQCSAEPGTVNACLACNDCALWGRLTAMVINIP